AVGLDQGIVLATAGLLALGIVMVTSTSMVVAESYSLSRWHYLVRHLFYIGVGLGLAASLRFVSIAHIKRLSNLAFPGAVVLLLLPFVPGLGHKVNGAVRWIDIGVVRLQVVEPVKLLVILFMAAYLARRTAFQSARFAETLKPLLLVGLLAGIVLKHPDMGSAMVLAAIAGGMVWLAGAAWKHLFVLGLGSLPLLTFAALEPYRFERVLTFVDPWADPYNNGFQLIQALIAVGRGQIGGVGLGASVQKLYYLPEAHTDFIFAVLAEELGLVGIVAVLAMFVLLIARMFAVGIRAQRQQRPFAAFVCWGVALWLGLQALVSMGVNLGMLPTNGLPLPLISAGGSSMAMTILAIGIVLRIQWELGVAALRQPRRRRSWET
ncbi:MAG TPA: putative lipid II flippase FtsW, partial [Wenzhouxiangella sp.]|nr:putative lipid II flippase FtsW [Wenzhouxiangella sp.]